MKFASITVACCVSALCVGFARAGEVSLGTSIPTSLEANLGAGLYADLFWGSMPGNARANPWLRQADLQLDDGGVGSSVSRAVGAAGTASVQAPSTTSTARQRDLSLSSTHRRRVSRSLGDNNQGDGSNVSDLPAGNQPSNVFSSDTPGSAGSIDGSTPSTDTQSGSNGPGNFLLVPIPPAAWTGLGAMALVAAYSAYRRKHMGDPTNA